jgi:hypothetical protein
MNLANWSVEDAIQKRVDAEDLFLWATGELAKYEAPLAKPLEEKEKKWGAAAKHVWGANLIKHIHSVMP